MQKWMISANSDKYDHAASFAKNGYIDWRQNNTKYEVGDIVYIYSSKHDYKVKYKTKVVKVKISFSEITDDKEFWKDLKEYEKAKNGYYVRLKLLEQVDREELSLKNLKENGLAAAPQGAMKFYDNLLNYIEKYFEFKEDFNEDSKNRNVIYFGAPGTGKSYKLNQDKDNLIIDENDYERVTFHPDYSYANFVGTYKPVMEIIEKDGENEKTISYEYVPGPFMRSLVKALKNPEKPFLLIIEEINRANVAAVFGEVFQLLDRDENNESKYDIETTEDIRKHLEEKLKDSIENDNDLKDYLKSILKEDFSRIKIPSNMFIWATMNSADQGVFPMDTAFKRRWYFKYFGINHNEEEMDNITCHFGNNIISWNDIRHVINKELLSYKINEDKLLGPFFAYTEYMKTGIGDEEFKEIFKNKIIMYLFEDAAKSKRNELFEGAKENKDDNVIYSRVCEVFDEEDFGIFSEKIEKELNEMMKEEESLNSNVVEEESDNDEVSDDFETVED